MRSIGWFVFSVLLAGCVHQDFSRGEGEADRPTSEAITGKEGQQIVKPTPYVSWFNDPNRKIITTDFKADYFIHPQTVQHGLVGDAISHLKGAPKAEIDRMIAKECSFLDEALHQMEYIYDELKKREGPLIDANYSIALTIQTYTTLLASASYFPYGNGTFIELINMAQRSVYHGSHQAVDSFKDKCINEIGYAKYQSILTNPRWLKPAPY